MDPVRPDSLFIYVILEAYSYPPRQKLKESAQHLKLRPDDFEGILVGLGFSPAEHLGTTGEGGT